MGAHGVLFLLAPAVQETAVLELWEAFCLPSGLGAGKDGPDAAQLLWIYMQMRTHQPSSPVECLCRCNCIMASRSGNNKLQGQGKLHLCPCYLNWF